MNFSSSRVIISLLRKQSRGFAKELRSSGSIAWLPLILILIGIALRLAQYMANRSLWLDESCLALKILHRSLGQLLEPLDYGQAAPLAFLMVEKQTAPLAFLIVEKLVVRPFVFDRFQNRVQSCEFHTSVSGGELPVHLHLRRVTGALPGSDCAC
jgi:hypothetical protein